MATRASDGTISSGWFRLGRVWHLAAGDGGLPDAIRVQGLLALVRGSPRLAGLGLPAARYPGRMDQIDSAAAEAKVLDLDGKEHALRELWAGRTAVLVFLRHFG